MASAIGNILTGGLFAGINGLIDRIKGKSPEDAAKLAELAQKYQSDVLATDADARRAQAEINKIEAVSSSLFVSGWRPFVGWVCGSGLAYQFVVRPLAMFVVALCGHPVVAPDLDMGTLITLLLGLLGLGGLRTYEKLNGVNAGH